MAYALDADGRLDLSSCYLGMSYDFFALETLSKEYFYAELCDLVAWDGTPIVGMRDPKGMPWRHLSCKHNHDKGPLNQIADLDPERIRRFPVLREVVMGLRSVDIYEQKARNGTLDKVEIVVQGIDENYLVSLGAVRGGYRIRSAYPAGERYVNGKVKRTGTLIEKLRP